MQTITEQERQICQIRISRFGVLPGEQPDRAPTDCAAAMKRRSFMIPLCEMYGDGRIKTPSEAKNMRDKMIREQGIDAPCPSARKKAKKQPQEHALARSTDSTSAKKKVKA